MAALPSQPTQRTRVAVKLLSPLTSALPSHPEHTQRQMQEHTHASTHTRALRTAGKLRSYLPMPVFREVSLMLSGMLIKRDRDCWKGL